MEHLRPLLTAVALTVLFAPAFGQSPDVTVLRGQSDQTYKRLVEADRTLAAGKPAEAADALQRILDEAGDDLVSADGKHFRPARRVAQRVLVKLPADALKAYRDRADEPAKLLLEAGRKARDPKPLRLLIDRYFASRPAEEALLLLGELAFERGDFRTAESVWRRLLPNSGNDLDPAFPDPKIDPSAVRARVALASIFQGELNAARNELKAIATANPKASGRLAGVDGPFADTLQKLLDRPPVLGADANGDGEWTAFAGSPSRSGTVSGRLPYYWPSRPTWQVPIPRDDVQVRLSKLPRVAPTKSVAFHPVVLDGIAYIADQMRVFGFDPRTGMNVFAYDLRTQVAGSRFRAERVLLPLNYDADFTLAASDGLLVARLGFPKVTELSPDPTGRPGLSPSVLVGFRRGANPVPGSAPLEPKWSLLPPGPAPEFATWEGAPILAEGRIYAPFARLGNRVTHAVACYEDPPGNPVWIAELAESPSNAERTRHELLTLAGGNLVYCTHTGAVIAIDAQSGKPSWAMKYPHIERTAVNPPQRDLAPPLAEGGRIFVAPSDAEFLYALEAETGRLLWQSGPIQIDQLLGATRGRLICTIAGPSRGIRGFGIRDGNYLEPIGWNKHDDPQLASFGRGLVSNDLILWPTKTDLFLLNPETGMPLRPPIRGPHGNLAFANGVVLVATPTELWGYVADRVELPERAAEVVTDDRESKRRLALALADAGKWDAATTALRGDEDAPRLKAEWATDRAERALAAGQVDSAERILMDIVTGDSPSEWKVRAAGRLMLLEPSGGKEPKAAAFFERLDLPRGFDAGVLYDDKVRPIRLKGLAARHFDFKLPDRPDDETAIANGLNAGDPILRHRLGVGSRVESLLTLHTNGFIPLRPFGGMPGLPGFGPEADSPVLLMTDGRQILAYTSDSTKPLWSSPLPEGLTVYEAVLSGSKILATGPRGAVKLDRQSGKILASILLPETDPLSSRSGLPKPRSYTAHSPAPSLSDFVVSGSLLIARLGQHHRIAFHRSTLDVESVIDSFAPQFSTGEFGPDLVPALNFDAGGEASLTGEPPRILTLPQSYLVGVRRNHGVELYRHSSARGDRMWGNRTSLLTAGDFDPRHADFDETRVYIPAEGKLNAVNLKDGQMAWMADLNAEIAGRSTTEWQVRVGRKTVAVFPIRPLVVDEPLIVARRMFRSFGDRPNPGRVPGLLLGLYDAWANRTLPIVFLDPETGRVVHRLDLPAGPVAVVQFGPERSVVVTGDRIYRLQSP